MRRLLLAASLVWAVAGRGEAQVVVGPPSGIAYPSAPLAGNYSGSATRDLTESSATAMFDVTLADTAVPYAGGIYEYCIDAKDATPNYQTRCGLIVWTMTAKAGTAYCQLASYGSTCASTKGASKNCAGGEADALTVTFTGANSSGSCRYSANAASDLTQTLLRISWFARQATASTQSVAVVP